MRYLYRNLLFAAIIALSTLPIYIVTLQISKENTVQSVERDFAVGFTDFTNLVNNLVNQSDLIMNDSSVLLLLNSQGKLMPKEYPRMLSARNGLGRLILPVSAVKAAYLMGPKNQLFLSSSIVSDDRSTVYGAFYELDGMSKAEWEALIFQDTRSYFFVPSHGSNSLFAPPGQRDHVEMLHLVVPMLSSQSLASSNRLVYMLTTDDVLAYFLKEPFRGQCSVTLEDKAGTVLASYGAKDAQDASKAQVFARQSRDFRCVLAVNNAYFDQPLAPVRSYLTIYAGVVLLFAMLLSFLMSQQQQRSYKEEQKAVEASIRNGLLGRLLRGELYAEKQWRECENLLGLMQGTYRVLAMRIANANTLDSSIANVMLRDTLQNRAGITALSYNRDASLIYFLMPVPEAAPELLPILGEVIEEVKQAHGLELRLGLGSVVEGIQRIGRSADTAESALWQCDEKHPLRAYRIYEGQPEPFLSYDMLTRLRDILASGSKEYVEGYFETLHKRLETLPGLSELEMNRTYYCLLSVITELTMQRVPQEYEEPEDAPSSFSERLRYLERYALLFCEKLRRNNAKGNEELARRICAYVDTNYANPSLSAALLGDAFQISEKYVFSLIKSTTGMSLGEYIEKVRFAQVETLLLSQANINDIPERVGYNSVNTFYKAFKRIYGISPAKWRSMQ